MRRGRYGMLAATLLASITAACNHDRGPMASLPPPAAGGTATVAFDYIDGPPVGISRKLVQHLSEEADGRQLAVVSREGPAHYRVRGYLAAHIDRRKVFIAWVWDVYDAAQNRALRIAGEEAVPGRWTVSNGWSAADDRVLRRIAQASIAELAAFVGAPAPAGDSAPPEAAVAGVVSAPRPEPGPTAALAESGALALAAQ